MEVSLSVPLSPLYSSPLSSHSSLLPSFIPPPFLSLPSCLPLSLCSCSSSSSSSSSTPGSAAGTSAQHEPSERFSGRCTDRLGTRGSSSPPAPPPSLSPPAAPPAPPAAARRSPLRHRHRGLERSFGRGSSASRRDKKKLRSRRRSSGTLLNPGEPARHGTARLLSGLHGNSAVWTDSACKLISGLCEPNPEPPSLRVLTVRYRSARTRC